MTLFDRFMVISKRKHDAAVAELLADGEFRDKRIAELEAELAPFREYVAAGEAEVGDGEAQADETPAEAGQAG